MESRLPNSVDVFVAGGGPAGLATAIAARRHGLSVVVADGAIPPIDKPCGEGLLPDGVDALLRLGVRVPESEIYPFYGLRFVDKADSVAAEFPGGAAYGIRRTVLHRILVDHAASCGVQMLWRTAVTGLHPEGAVVNGQRFAGVIQSRWVVGADGINSRVRAWARLGHPSKRNHRFAFRRHYRVAPWTRLAELHWGRDCQIYVTPVGRDEVCVALVSSSPKLRLDDAFAEFPDLYARLRDAEPASSERGAITVSRRLRHLYRGRAVLVGDASGGVDAITGEGLCLTFRQAALLGECLSSGDLDRYEKGHRTLFRRPTLMARIMLSLSRHSYLRQRAIQLFQSSPRSLAAVLALHVGETSNGDCPSRGVAVGSEIPQF
jgi:menaquinone-9 beta-reductase